MIALIRVPYLSEYNLLDVREEPVVSALAGYLRSIGARFRVFDFHLDHSLTIDDVVASDALHFVISVRGTGLHWKYAERVMLHLLAATTSPVIIYGQTGKLRHWHNPAPDRVSVVPHDERALAAAVGLSLDGPAFTGSLTHHPYAVERLHLLGDRRKLFKATIETTRGCHFGCRFCFINHGTNYPERFQRRPNESVLTDMRTYRAHGIDSFWFYDSEFIGADRNHYGQIRNLLTSIRDEMSPNVEIMIYSRADTLERLDEYLLMAAAGVNSVLLGIESLDQVDLKTMRKGQGPDTALRAIRNLRDHKIFCNLSFILFNRSSTIDSLERNIDLLAELYGAADYIYLGQTIYFSYAFESDWGPNPDLRALSGRTRLHGSTTSTRAPGAGVTFDPTLEPFAEICRIINYEQVRKLCELNLAKEAPGSVLRSLMHRWATLLNLLTLNLMRGALDEFKANRLTVASVPEYERWVYDSFKDFNAALLPQAWRPTLTDAPDAYPDDDWNGWGRQIPVL